MRAAAENVLLTPPVGDTVLHNTLEERTRADMMTPDTLGRGYTALFAAPHLSSLKQSLTTAMVWFARAKPIAALWDCAALDVCTGGFADNPVTLPRNDICTGTRTCHNS